MRSGRTDRTNPGRQTRTTGKTVRTTIVIPATLDENLEAMRLTKGGTKNDLIRDALMDFLRAAGYEPLKHPTVSITYEH